MDQILGLRTLAIGRTEIRQSGMIMHYEEKRDYSVLETFKVMQFDGVHISVFIVELGRVIYVISRTRTSQRHLIPGYNLALAFIHLININ